MEQTNARRKESKKTTATGYETIVNSSGIGALGIALNSDTARQAVVLSEIIGKPLAKRKRHR